MMTSAWDHLRYSVTTAATFLGGMAAFRRVGRTERGEGGPRGRERVCVGLPAFGGSGPPYKYTHGDTIHLIASPRRPPMAIPLLPDDPHDRQLRANVKPPGWANPTPADRYQLVVIG